VHYGAGLAGWKGEAPRVSVSSPQSLGNPAFAVQLANAAPRSTAVLLVGTSKVQVPVGGGYLWNDAKWLVLRPTDPDGDASWMPSIGAAPGLAGVSVLLQWAVIDTAAPAGWSVTDGLDLVLD
jgi:hypothetical protein